MQVVLFSMNLAVATRVAAAASGKVLVSVARLVGYCICPTVSRLLFGPVNEKPADPFFFPRRSDSQPSFGRHHGDRVRACMQALTIAVVMAVVQGNVSPHDRSNRHVIVARARGILLTMDRE